MDKVYIETSIPSFYHETRTEAEFVAMRNWTRQWKHIRRINERLRIPTPEVLTPLELMEF